ncbi:MAG: DoxX family protein [Ferruginibacter sp.]
MKVTVNIARILTGALFIFSGLIKAIDPRGLAYKMQEFFEAWANSGFLPKLMAALGEHALSFSVIMITLEVAVGVALLLGWQKKLTTWILFLLILFFTFLTSYVLFSGKIRACGCFGDCIPITPVQTFTKDIILLLLSLLLLWKQAYIRPLLGNKAAGILVLLATVATLFLQWYVQRHLPLKDCLPYKKGNNILELRKMPANAVPDKYEMTFVYKKGAEQKEFKMDALPDSTWEFVDRKQVLVEKGKNNVPVITDFVLTTESGTDTTEALLSQPGEYYLLFLKDASGLPGSFKKDKELLAAFAGAGIPAYIVSAGREMAAARYLQPGTAQQPVILTGDATTIKTAARADLVLYKMRGPVIENKWGWADLDKVKP